MSSSRRQTVCGLIHSFWRWTSGCGRYQQTFSKYDPAAGADGVEGELLALDELLDRDLLDMLGEPQGALELGAGVAAVGVGRTGAGDRLDDHRIADLLRGVAHLVLGLGAEVARGADAGRVERAAS